MITRKIINGEKRNFIFLVFACVVMVFFMAILSPAEAQRKRRKTNNVYSPPYSAIVVDVKTGKILHANNIDARRYPASVTKVMTLYLLFEQLEAGKLKLETQLRVSAYAASQAPSKIGLRAGQTISVQEAIGALVTKSANDASVVVAEAIGGSEKNFANMMTKKARALGMKNTVFRNPHGLPNSGQYTTARDLSILGRAIQERFPVHYRHFQTRVFTYKNAAYPNHNKLLGRIEGVDGIKTGYTNASGFNLLTNVKTNNRHIVAVVLGGHSGYARDQAMTDLIGSYLPVAYAGNSTASPVVNAQARQVADANIPSQPQGEPLKLNNFKAVVTTSLDTPSAVTPSFIDKNIIYASAGTNLPDGTFQFASLPIDSSGNIINLKSRNKTPSTNIENAQGSKNNISPTTKVSLPTVAPTKAIPPQKVKVVQDVVPSQIDGWIIQLAATGDKNSAQIILDNAKNLSGKALVQAAPFTEKFERDDGSTFYRARFSGFAERKDALSACNSLKKNGFSCFASRG